METRYWQMKRQAITGMITVGLLAFIAVPFMIAYKFNKATIIIELILLTISLIILFAQALKGRFNRVFISREGFAIKSIFKKQFYSWDQVEHCKEELFYESIFVDICYKVILKQKDSNTPRSILIQMHKNAQGEFEKYIDVEMIQNKTEPKKKRVLHLDSWQQSTKKFSISLATIDAVLLVMIVVNIIRALNYKVIPSFIKGAVIVLIVEMILIFLYALLKRKKRIEVDSIGMSVWFYSVTFKADWRDVTGVSVVNSMSGRRISKDIKITLADKKEIPFSAVSIEKTNKLSNLIKKYYKPSEENA